MQHAVCAVVKHTLALKIDKAAAFAVQYMCSSLIKLIAEQEDNIEKSILPGEITYASRDDIPHCQEVNIS